MTKTLVTTKFCGGCDGVFPRTSEFFYQKRKAGKFICSSRCRSCSIKRSLERHQGSQKWVEAQIRNAARAEARERRAAYRAAWEAARDARRQERAEERVAKASLPHERLRRGLRSRLRQIRTRYGLHPDIQTDNCIGCSWPDLVGHIEAQWYDGMSWTNYGSWHIDHIVPVSSADLTDRDDALAVFNFKNTRPLWGHENHKKGARVMAHQ